MGKKIQNPKKFQNPHCHRHHQMQCRKLVISFQSSSTSSYLQQQQQSSLPLFLEFHLKITSNYFDGAVIACTDGSKTFPRNRLNDDFCDCPEGTDEPDHKYYFDGAVIACTDDSKTFPRNRLNDGYCDCPDGTDDPGTAACPESKFYCRNAGDLPHFLFSSQVNDRICDCCDGSDEYDGGVICPNTCLGNGDNLNTKIDELDPTIITSNQVNAQQRTSRLDVEDFIQNLNGFRVAIVDELVAAICVVTFYLFYRRNRARRRRLLRRN